MLEIHQPAPTFLLKNQDEEEISLEQFRGQYVILYFYPKDDTPGCSKEACAFRDQYDQFQQQGVVVLGISKDSTKSHRKFIKKYELPFTLLSDEQMEVIKLYEAARGPITRRMCYLIDPEGTIIKAYPKVTPVDHAAEVLADLKSL